MGRHLDKVKRLDKLVAKFQDNIDELFKISKIGVKQLDKNLRIFTIAYAWLNYQLAIYLMSIFPKAIEADKIDKEFGKIMKNFNRRNGKKRKNGKK